MLNIRSGVTFHDGTPLDAEAVKFNLERNKSDPKSNIKADLASMASAEVTGPMQVTLKLNTPDAALPGILSDRAGMMVSPTALKASSAGNVARTPVGRRRLCFRELGRRREDRRQAQREILEARTGRIRMESRFSIIPELTTGSRSVTAGPERPDVPAAAAPEGDHGPRSQRQDRQRADALCLPDFPELGEAAVRQHQESARPSISRSTARPSSRPRWPALPSPPT